jgi:hypothetical protein
MNRSLWPLFFYFNAGSTEERIKSALPSAPSTNALDTPPTFFIINELAGLENAQTKETSARL